jgi:hypothetical protein
MVSVSIVLVEKSGELKQFQFREFDEADLYKKCSLKKADGFAKQTEWSVKLDGAKYFVSLYGKTDGKAGSENKYDFPPPVDSALFFGTCALVCRIRSDSGAYEVCPLSLTMWSKMYEKLFGGFEDLGAAAEEDEDEIDELEGVDKKKKTKQGYLKDGFVVDSSDAEDDGDSVSGTDSDVDSVSREDHKHEEEDDEEGISELDLAELANEIMPEEYDYSDLQKKK